MADGKTGTDQGAPLEIHTDAELDSFYGKPPDLILKAISDRIHPHHRTYLEQATFFCLATGRSSGLDTSPRGGPKGFVQVIDDQTVAFADWPGNNRIESMRNLIHDDRLAMLFLFPGLDIFLRLNGTATISTDPDLLERVAEGKGRPKTAIVVHVRELIFHCGKAASRAELWSADSHIEKGSLPSAGVLMRDLADVNEVSVEDMDAEYDHGMKTDLF